MRNVSDKSYRENQNTHILCAITVFRKSCRLRDNVEKYCTAGQATDDNMAHASGVPRNFVRGGVQQIQLRTERTGIWGQWPPSQGLWRQL
jgi:hypothetical protein